jgi:hypothetical protein
MWEGRGELTVQKTIGGNSASFEIHGTLSGFPFTVMV